MANSKDNPYTAFWMLGIAMLLPLVLVSGPLAGYLIWRFAAVRVFGTSSAGMFVFIASGMILSGIQVVRLIRRIQDAESKQKK